MGVVGNGALGFATSGTSFDMGSAPTVGDFDVIGVNSDTTVSTPSGFTLLDSAVANQGSYFFYREAVGGEGQTVSITTTGDHEATLVWVRVRNAVGIDKNAKATAAGSSSGSTPTATTATLTDTGELAVAFAGLHRFAGADPVTPIWSNSFTGLDLVTQGTGNPACCAISAYKEGVGTSAVAVDVSWTNGCFDRDQYVVTFVMDTAVAQEVLPSGIASSGALGSVAVTYNQSITGTGISSGEAFGTSGQVSAGYTPILSVQGQLNRIAGTTGLGSQGAANVIAGTTGLATVGALNTYMGNDISNWLDLPGVANQMAGTTGLGTALALSLVAPV